MDTEFDEAYIAAQKAEIKVENMESAHRNESSHYFLYFFIKYCLRYKRAKCRRSER